MVDWLLNEQVWIQHCFYKFASTTFIIQLSCTGHATSRFRNKVCKNRTKHSLTKRITSCLDTLLYLLTDKNFLLYMKEILKCSVSKMKSSIFYLILSFLHLGFAEYEKIVYYQPEQIHLALGGNHKHLFTF
jgi:hypothetical protein